MKFKRTDETLKNHTTKQGVKEIGFFKQDNDKYNSVVFMTEDETYFNAYGNILKVV